MSSQKARKRPFRLYEGACADDHYIRLTSYMLEHEAFRNLTVYAKVLYVYMRNHAGAFSDTTTYSTNTATRSTETTKPIMSAHMYRKARDELIEAGFICWVNKSLSKYSNHAPAEFEFIDEWHTGKQSKLF